MFMPLHRSYLARFDKVLDLHDAGDGELGKGDAVALSGQVGQHARVDAIDNSVLEAVLLHLRLAHLEHGVKGDRLHADLGRLAIEVVRAQDVEVVRQDGDEFACVA